MPRVPGGLAAFREMLSASLEEPRRKLAAKTLDEALNRSLGKGKGAMIPTRVPEFPKGSIFDYKDFGADPRAYLERKDIALPQTERGFESVAHAFRSPNQMQSMLQAAKEGASQGGHLWYNTAPIHDFAYKYAPEADVSEFLRMGAPFSAQAAVDKELKQTAFVNYFLKKHGRFPEPDEMMQAGNDILGGGGSMVNKLQWSKEGVDEGELQALKTAHGSLAGKAKVIPYDEARQGNTW